uniref:T9SS type A sorting domain-containing protein n=1 Tax=Flavobacterium sp. TaxID=239 RepID=UPI0040498DDA
MKKFLSFYFVFFCLTTALAQKEINTEFANKMNFAFQPLEKNRVPFGLLKDQAFEFTELSAYNGVVTDSNYVQPVTIKQIYNTLLSARIHASASQFIQPDEYEQRWQANRSQGIITLSGLFYNYAQFNVNAVTSNKLQVINNQFKDKYIGSTWQNPYETKQVFAIAPSVRKYKGYNLSIKFPANLWFTNATQSVQNIQIDANDGLGYRTTTFGQILSVTYTSSGLKSWKYKITLNNGQILYSHSKIIIEEGLVTIPHIDSYGANQIIKQPTTNNLSNTNELGRKNIIATKDYNGSFGSAKVVIDYASADRKIRRPLIVAEGFDQGILTNPEEEFGITSYLDFKTIVNNSQSGELQSLLTNVNTKQYDIIWVDWNNGVDYIQKNAYVLEEVIKWVNNEKLANNSSQSNVVLGASMGGLIVRFALKDMEDNSLPTQTSLYISHDAPHQGANFPIGYQYMSRHALHQYVQSPLLLAGGEVIMPLFTDGVTPLDFLLLQNTPAARQMLINYVGINYGITNTFHNDWQTELRLKGYPSMRKIAISNGNHCATTQNAPAGANLLSIDGNYSTGWLTDIVLTAFPSVNSSIFQSLAILTNEPGFLVGILPGGNKIKLDFKVNSLPSAGTNQIYKGKITYTKKLLWLVNINVTITDKSFNSPTNTLPYDYYPGGTIETGIRNSATASGGSFWQQAFVKYKMNISTEPSFCFIPTTSALDIGLGNVILNNDDYLKKYNVNAGLVTPKVSPFNNYITSFQDSFILDFEDNIQSTNEHHIYLHLRNANWLAREIDNIPNNNQVFNCSFMCNNTQITGVDLLCTTATYQAPNGGTFHNWSITQGANLVTSTGNNTNSFTLTALPNASGPVTISLFIEDDGTCGGATITKNIWVGKPVLTANNWNFCKDTYQREDNSISVLSNPLSNITEYEWMTGNFVGEPFPEVPVNIISSFLGKAYFSAPSVGNGLVQVRAKNQCGWTNWFPIDVYVTNCNPVGGGGVITSYRTANPKIYTIYPNPAKDMVHIAITDSKNIVQKDGTTTGLLYDMMGLVKAEVAIINNKATFSVAQLPKGIYVLKINVNNQIESHQIAVE